jgi:hypothetical protein
VRVYRHRNTKTPKDFTAPDLKFEPLRNFIIHSTFIGPAPGISRELSTENGLKIFQYNLPVLILFRNTSNEESRYYQEQLSLAEREIGDEIMVCIGDVNNEMTRKVAMLTGVEDLTQVAVRILDPNPGKTSVKKYYYN